MQSLSHSVSTVAPSARASAASRRGSVRAAAPAPRASRAAQDLSFKQSSFVAAGVPVSRSQANRPQARALATLVQAYVTPRNILIVNTNGGGHAGIGFWLSRKLSAHGHNVTLCIVGSQYDKKMEKPPFTYLEELRRLKTPVNIVWGNPNELGSAIGPDAYYDVIDNNGKDLESVGPVIEYAYRVSARQFLFVSSAGIYKTTAEPPHIEGDAVKEDSGHAQVEQRLRDGTLQWSSFRPQYITGYGSNKDCEEWFFERLARGRPVPIPGSGMQLTCIAHVEDMAEMITLAVGNEDANGHIFNCTHNRSITLAGMARLCAKIVGVEPSIVNWDPKKVEGVDVKKAFPFRPVHFYAEPRNAMKILGWKPKWDLETALRSRYIEYLATGRAKKDKAFPEDDIILQSLGVSR